MTRSGGTVDLFLAGATQANQNVIWTGGGATIVLKNVYLDEISLENFAETMAFESSLY